MIAEILLNLMSPYTHKCIHTHSYPKPWIYATHTHTNGETAGALMFWISNKENVTMSTKAVELCYSSLTWP